MNTTRIPLSTTPTPTCTRRKTAGTLNTTTAEEIEAEEAAEGDSGMVVAISVMLEMLEMLETLEMSEMSEMYDRGKKNGKHNSSDYPGNPSLSLDTRAQLLRPCDRRVFVHSVGGKGQCERMTL